MSTPFQISLAPEQLWQAINPMTFYQQGAQFGLINIDLGAAGESDLERKLLDRVGSYGRQLGRIGDALEVILKHVKLGDLKPEEQDALDILKGQLAAVRQVKAGQRASDRPTHQAGLKRDRVDQAASSALNKTLELAPGCAAQIGLVCNSDPGLERASWANHMRSETIGIGGLELRFLRRRTGPPAASTRSR